MDVLGWTVLFGPPVLPSWHLMVNQNGRTQRLQPFWLNRASQNTSDPAHDNGYHEWREWVNGTELLFEAFVPFVGPLCPSWFRQHLNTSCPPAPSRTLPPGRTSISRQQRLRGRRGEHSQERGRKGSDQHVLRTLPFL